VSRGTIGKFNCLVVDVITYMSVTLTAKSVCKDIIIKVVVLLATILLFLVKIVRDRDLADRVGHAIAKCSFKTIKCMFNVFSQKNMYVWSWINIQIHILN
jgi:hypothetical protein